MNSIAVMKLLRQINSAAAGTREPPGRNTVSYDEAPERARTKTRVRKSAPPPPEPDSSTSESEESESDSGYSSYESVEHMKLRLAQEPCEYVSPSGLNDKKTTKEAVAYLKEKKCPKLNDMRKQKAMSSKPPAPPTVAGPADSVEEVKKRSAKRAAAPAAPAAAAPKAPAEASSVQLPAKAPAKARTSKRAVVQAAAPAAVVPAAPAPAAPAPAPAPAAPAAPKAKRAPSAYAVLVGKYCKQGLSFTEAAKKAKADIDASKAAK